MFNLDVRSVLHYFSCKLRGLGKGSLFACRYQIVLILCVKVILLSLIYFDYCQKSMGPVWEGLFLDFFSSGLLAC